MINVGMAMPCSRSDGPGKRFTLWVQGCGRGCPGCGNSQLQLLTKENRYSCQDVFCLVEEAQGLYGIEGVTFTGGEPMLQAHDLSLLAEMCQSVGLSVVVFTGYLMKDLGVVPGAADLLARVDILVDGPFIKEKPETVRSWVGSSNQAFHFLSSRHGPGVEFLPGRLSSTSQLFEGEFLLVKVE